MQAKVTNNLEINDLLASADLPNISVLEENMNCRLCLNKCEDSVSIFAENDDESLWKLIFKYLYLKIQPDDFYSTNLCSNCTKNLQNFHSFCECVQKCQSKLQPTQQVPAETLTLESIRCDLIFKEESALWKSRRCRLCMDDCEDAVSIIMDKDENSWLQWTNKYLFMKIEPGDLHSTSMCLKCTKYLQNFHNFFQYIQNCQFSLKNMDISENATTTKSDSIEEDLMLKIEMEEEFLENHSHENCKIIYDNIGLEQFNEDKSMDKSFLNISVKTEFLSAEVESDTYENDECLEDSETTNELTGNGYVSVNETIICGTCGIMFESKLMLDNHLKATMCNQFQEVKSSATDDMKSRTCTICLKVSSTIGALRVHMYNQHREKQDVVQHRTCRICSKVLSTVKGLKDHMRNQHTKKQEAIEQRTCRICSKVFETIGKRKNHMRKQHDKKNEDIANRTCPICCKVLSTVKNLRLHLDNKHSEMQDVENRTCRICSKVFETIGKRKNHMRKQHDKKNEDIANRSCSICSAVLSTVHGLREHMGSQHNEKNENIVNRSCSICSAVLSTVKGLRIHMRFQHSTKQDGTENRTCRICSKIFDKNIQLNFHMSEEHKDSEEASIFSKKQSAEMMENTNKLTVEKTHTKEEQYPVEFQVKEEEPLEIDDFL